MSPLAPDPVEGPDADVTAVVAELQKRGGHDPTALYGLAIRQVIDEVLDGPRTGRWDFAQLEKTEKTYVGTRLEIVVRAALGLERGSNLDLEIAGVPVDIKWAMDSRWQIPVGGGGPDLPLHRWNEEALDVPGRHREVHARAPE